MNTEKLLNLLYNLENLNEEEKLSALFKELASLVTGSDASAIEEKKTEIYKILDTSTANSFPYSDAEALEKIGANIFFGRSAKKHLETFFNTNGHLLQQNIEEYVAERQKFILNISEMKESLQALNFKAHFNDEEFELGITLPDRFRNLDDAAKAIQDWNNFLSYLVSTSGEDSEIKISLVSEGSITFFVLASAAMARTINIFMGEIANFYEQIGRIKKVQLESRFLESQVIREELKTKMEEEKAKFISTVTQKMLTDLNIPKEDMNNSTAELSGRVKKILTLTEKGARIELIPPEIDFEDETKTQKVPKAEQKKILDQVDEIKNINEKLTPLYLGLGSEPLLLEDEIGSEVESISEEEIDISEGADVDREPTDAKSNDDESKN